MKRFLRIARSGVLAAICYFASGTVILGLEKIEKKACLPAELAGKTHNDYPLYARSIPREITSWCMAGPPIMIIGNQKAFRPGTKDPLPIPSPEERQISVVQVRKNWPLVLPYLAMTTKHKWHLRIGARWNPTEGYYTFPSITIKQLQ